MSKLINMISSELTGNQFPAGISPLLDVSLESKVEDRPYQFLKEYKIGINFGMTARCNSCDEKLLINNIISEYKALVFGDIRSLIQEMERAVYNQDLKEIKKVLRELLIEVD